MIFWSILTDEKVNMKEKEEIRNKKKKKVVVDDINITIPHTESSSFEIKFKWKGCSLFIVCNDNWTKILGCFL